MPLHQRKDIWVIGYSVLKHAWSACLLCNTVHAGLYARFVCQIRMLVCMSCLPWIVYFLDCPEYIIFRCRVMQPRSSQQDKKTSDTMCHKDLWFLNFETSKGCFDHTQCIHLKYSIGFPMHKGLGILTRVHLGFYSITHSVGLHTIHYPSWSFICHVHHVGNSLSVWLKTIT